MKAHTYECDNLVVGNSLESVIAAYLLGATYIQNIASRPFVFDYFSPSVDLEFLGMQNILQERITSTSQQEVGLSKARAWEELMYQLSLSGALPFSNEKVKLRLKENRLRAVLKETRVFEFRYENLFLFDDENIFGLPSPLQKKVGSCTIYDWFDVHQGCTHKYDVIETGEDLVNQINFYPSPRIDGNDGSLKDLVATSFVAGKEQLFEIEYSDLYSRLKIIKLLKDNHIFGEKNTPPKIELNRRDVVYHMDVEYEFEEDNIHFLTLAMEDIEQGKFDW